MPIDWDEAAAALKRDVAAHGGFLTIQREKFKERFGIVRLVKNNTEEILTTLNEHGLIVLPHPYYVQGASVRVYDVESAIGKIALAIANPQDVPESALVDVVKLHERANAGQRRRSVTVPWLSAFDVFLQIVIGRPPEGWEDLEDDRELYQLAEGLAASLGLPIEVVHAEETLPLAGAVWACRPRLPRWEDAPPALVSALAEAARKKKEIFIGLLRAAARHLLEEDEVPSRDVDLGRLGLRYRRELKGGVGWLR